MTAAVTPVRAIDQSITKATINSIAKLTRSIVRRRPMDTQAGGWAFFALRRAANISPESAHLTTSSTAHSSYTSMRNVNVVTPRSVSMRGDLPGR
jgi:hypothetical protein